jgi:serine O-acetyltransferase
MFNNIVYRLYKAEHYLFKKKVPLLPELIRTIIRFGFFAYIPPKCEIGKNALFAYNGLGVVLNSGAKLGNNVVIGVYVVLGRKYGKFGLRTIVGDSVKDINGVPTMGDNVVIGAGAILLGSINVGDNAVIGAGSLVLNDVPKGATVVGVPARIIKETLRYN